VCLTWTLNVCFITSRTGPANTKEVVKVIVEDLAPKDGEGDILVICIRRTDLIEDALREGKKGKFVPGKVLQVIQLYT